MPTPVRRKLRLARRGLGYTVAVTLVLVAMLLGVASQMLPLVDRNPDKVAAWLSQRAGRPVSFDRVETGWTRRGPLLQLENLRVGEGERAFAIGDAEMLVSIYAGLWPGTAFSELRLRGLDLVLERAGDGRWRVRGLPGQDQVTDGDPLEALEGLGELQVIDGKLAVIAPSLGIDARIPRVDVRLRVDGDRVRAGVRAWPQPSSNNTVAVPLDAVLDFDRRRGDGRAYAGAKRANLASWSNLLQLMGVAVEGGEGRAEAWATVRRHRVDMVTLAAELEGVRLAGAAIAPGGPVPTAGFDRVDARVRWRLIDNGWRFDAPLLRVGRGEQRQTLDGLVLAGGQQHAVLAERLDAGPLLAVVALSDRVPPTLRRWLQRARPVASLRGIELKGRRDGPLLVQVRVDAAGFQPVDANPGIRGLAGDLEGDADGIAMALDPAAAVTVDWPRAFRAPQRVALGGTVSGWREGPAWQVGTAALRVSGKDYGADVRGGLRWQGDGSRPWIDLAAVVDEAQLPVAKTLWIRHLMSEGLIDWLDRGLVSGTVTGGRALISGDLDDWPFADGGGYFEANAHISNGTFDYQPGWPVAEQVELDARFLNDGLSFAGTGSLAGLKISQLRGGIDHYRGGRLTVDASGEGDARELLGLLRRSPLQAAHADTLANLDASGRTAIDFNLALPLGAGTGPSITGHVDLANARLAEKRWDLAFDQVAGRIEYSRGGFRASDLRVRRDGQPGRLSLRAGEGFVRDRGNAFEAGLDAAIEADDLIDRAPQLAWLKPHFDGRSAWNIGIAIGQAARGAGARLKLSSNLVGTELTLPAPLRKAAGTPLTATVETPLPLGSGEIRVALGNLMGLRARSSQSQTGVRIALGSNDVPQAPPVSGLVASGRVAALDALDWIALTRAGSGGEGEGEGLPLQRIDITAQRLQLLGGTFPNTRVLVTPAPAGATAVQADGAALKGSLLVPAGDAGLISGRFERVHWRSATATAAVPATAGATRKPEPSAKVAVRPVPRPDADSIDPARIPPLAFDIADLRVGNAALGTATVRTRPTAAGLRIEQFQTRSTDQAIRLTGNWTGRAAAEQTRVAVRLDSQDLGALLAGFGFGGRMAGGDGSVQFNAGWRGSPAAYSLAGMEGSLMLAARDGRLLEVEPGAGRVLGLLSLAELPRRLSLDFRDFFDKGFAFNRIDGTVEFGSGNARSDNLMIDGPAAEIRIRGVADLHAKRFDQTIEVRPKAGNLLTAVGALAGGPVGAAIGAAANAVLQKPLGQIGAKTYKVTGPWADPKVEVLSREQGQRRAAVEPRKAG